MPTQLILRLAVLASLLLLALCAQAQTSILLLPSQTFDGTKMLSDDQAAVLVQAGHIVAIGPTAVRSASEQIDVQRIELPGQTLLPGLIDLHSHVLLHPYDETPWNDQVLKESEAVRVARATNHVRNTLMAGFTTLRDLGSEGAGYADVGVKQAIQQGIIPGPRLLVAGPAIVATGSYGPKGFKPGFDVPLGANQADGVDGLLQEVRRQIGGGADWIKVYADYRWGPNGEARPTFSLEELELIVRTAASSGRSVVAHAATEEGMRRAVMAGVKTIEHGDGGTVEVFALMAEKGVAFCPTLGAVEAISGYGGWRKGVDPEPARVTIKKNSFNLARDAGVTICNGSDVGVFDHGDNAYELELLVEYGLSPIQALQAATSVNANLLNMGTEIGQVKVGFIADLVAVQDDPSKRISALRQSMFVMQAGVIRKHQAAE